MKFPIPEIALTQHIAVLGKTGSGKTNTAKTIIEHVVDGGARVCILDPIKSDWWGLISSADGKRPGLPFHILGGPRGHVPVHAAAGKAIAELVAAGTLPHSIIDMADFAPGGQAKFFIDFAPTLMRRMRGVVYLVLEEAHLFAPKERSGMGDENMMIHWAKMLATAGRTKGIRLLVLSQRTQALHNAVLGSCDTLIAQRMTAPADQKPVKDWLKANVDNETRQRVESSLASLKTGSGWLCSGEARIFDLVQFPRASTFDNTATPTGDGDAVEVRTAAVDREKLRAIVGDAVAEAQASDPAELRKRIKELEKQLAAGGKRTDADIVEARRTGKRDGYQEGFEHATYQFKQYAISRLDEARELFVKRLEDQAALMSQPSLDARPDNPVRSANVTPPRRDVAETSPNRAAGAHAREIDGRASTDLPPVNQRVLNALADLEQMGSDNPDRELVAFMAGYSNVNSKGFANAIGALRTAGLIDYPRTGVIALTDAGREQAVPSPRPQSASELQERVIRMLGGASGRVLQPLIDAYPRSVPRPDVAEAAGYGNVNSKGFANAIGRLRTLGFIDYPDRGTIVAKPVLFLEGG